VEDGQYVGLFLCEKELKANWNKRSRLDYNGKNLQGEELRYTIIRYLNAKGYRKDSVGLSKLTPDEIVAIEKGVANPGLLQPFNLSARIEGFFIDYKRYLKTGDANGKPELQRLEYWKAAWSIIKRNWLTGVGTGDVMDAFTNEFNQSHSKLEPGFRGTSHNQYLYMGVAFGIAGMFFFIFWLIYPACKLGKFRDEYFVAFLCIMLLSMLTEDTIHHQAGLNFIAFFGSLFLFGRERESNDLQSGTNL
ncbi:MAG: O-antigen ligase family protein, partial [Bacteroidota bacterium]|nr:O-antigen ligase family protein [Bacteroidota bacterium]